MKNENENFFYLRTKDGNQQVGVVAMRRAKNLANIIVVGISICSKGDHWDKKFGVNKAFGKINAIRLKRNNTPNSTYVSLKEPVALREVMKILYIPRRRINMEKAEEIFQRQIKTFLEGSRESDKKKPPVKYQSKEEQTSEK